MPDPNPAPPDVQAIVSQLPDAQKAPLDSFDMSGEGYSEKVVDSIEMIGEESASGLPSAPSQVSPGMRYLHSSRTIHQLVTDRNRAVGIYLAVTSLLLTASGAIYNASPKGALIIPIEEIQRWCLPITFAALTVLAVFLAFMLIRTRVGLIYEVAKMNALLGLPIGRVSRIGLMSVHTILHGLLSLGGGASAGLFAVFLARLEWPDAVGTSVTLGVVVGLLMTAALFALYVITVTYTTSDRRLQARV